MVWTSANGPKCPVSPEDRGEAPQKEKVMTGADNYEILRRTLETHAVKLMGPRSPFWRCQYCEALSQSPLIFPHKPECVMALPVSRPYHSTQGNQS